MLSPTPRPGIPAGTPAPCPSRGTARTAAIVVLRFSPRPRAVSPRYLQRCIWRPPQDGRLICVPPRRGRSLIRSRSRPSAVPAAIRNKPCAAPGLGSLVTFPPRQNNHLSPPASSSYGLGAGPGCGLRMLKILPCHHKPGSAGRWGGGRQNL